MKPEQEKLPKSNQADRNRTQELDSFSLVALELALQMLHSKAPPKNNDR